MITEYILFDLPAGTGQAELVTAMREVAPRWHANAVENLVVFATLVLVAQAVGAAPGSAIATACVVYFWARVIHAIAYAFAVPWVRTLAFTVGFFAQAVIAWQILVH